MTIEDKTEAIILRGRPYKERDAIISVYTYEFGKMAVIARGVKKLNSKNAPGLMDMTCSDLTIHARKGLSQLIRSEAKDYYHHIHDTIECEIIGQYMMEYFDRYVEDNKPSLKHYRFLKGVLEALNQGIDYRLIYCLINVFIMKENGIALDVDGCLICHRPQVVAFRIDEGGFVCSEHRQDGDVPYEVDVLKSIRYLYKCPIEKIGTLHLEDIKEASQLFEHYVQDYCGIHLKSHVFVKQIVS